MKQKPHLLFTWLDELVRASRLDAVESLIGPDILGWASGFFTKEPHDPSFVSWHQDSPIGGSNRPTRDRMAGALAEPARERLRARHPA